MLSYPGQGTVLLLVDRHRIASLVHERVRRGEISLPPPLQDELARRDREDRLAGLRHCAELARLCRLARPAGIPLVPLKGVVLSELLYGDPCLRHSKDLDLLIPPDRLGEMHRLLTGDGYRIASPSVPPDPRRERFLRKFIHHFSYVHPGRQVELELHWRAPFWSGAQLERFWGECRETVWHGETFLSPSREALLVYLLDHGSNHEWMRLKWLFDVAALLESAEPLDDGKLRELLAVFDMERAAWQCGELIRICLGKSPPPWMVPPPAERPVVERLVRRARTMMERSEEEIRTAGRRLDVLLRAHYWRRLRRRSFSKKLVIHFFVWFYRNFILSRKGH